jgi:hypothetical protein
LATQEHISGTQASGLSWGWCGLRNRFSVRMPLFTLQLQYRLRVRPLDLWSQRKSWGLLYSHRKGLLFKNHSPVTKSSKNESDLCVSLTRTIRGHLLQSVPPCEIFFFLF